MRWPQPPGAQARNRRMEGTCLGPRWAPELVDPPAPVWGKLPLQASRPPLWGVQGAAGTRGEPGPARERSPRGDLEARVGQVLGGAHPE